MSEVTEKSRMPLMDAILMAFKRVVVERANKNRERYFQTLYPGEMKDVMRLLRDNTTIVPTASEVDVLFKSYTKKIVSLKIGRAPLAKSDQGYLYK